MALDGFFINKLIEEIEPKIKHSRVERIEQISKDTFVFSLYYQKNRFYLYFKLNAPNASFFLGLKNTNNSYEGSNLLSILKKNIEGTFLSSIIQKDNDRVVILSFEGVDLLDGKFEKKLILELMGRHNNLILTKDNIIIDAYQKKFSESSRSILPKIEFTFFPTDKKPYVYNENLIIENKSFLSKSYIGISPLLSNYLFLNKIDIAKVNVRPTKDLSSNQFYWFDLFDESINKKSFNTLSELLESNVLIPNTNSNKYETFVKKELLKYEKKLEKNTEHFEEAYINLNFKNKGDAVYGSGLNLSNRYTEVIDFENNKIELNPLKTLNENAQDFYKKYQKAKRTIGHLDEQKKEFLATISLMKQFLYDIKNEKENFNEIEEQLIKIGFKNKKKKPNNKKKVSTSNILKYEYNQAIFLIGKNNLQNEELTHKIANHNDLWFHVENAPGSHVVLKGAINNQNLEIAAMLAAKYSSINEMIVIPVNYTQIKNIKKIPKIPGYQVIIKNYETINIKINNELLESIHIANKLK
ncbi:NFACT RNA binding domain-containing protein [Haploplasma axanthum]|uniref:Fibronectin-binding protein A N-terminus (FbpA) n=1 Tax=Haploplasma axanthum TaxID=29552 RepID=A0A449BFC4_HAPAX|nr:NFACT RNA binding domain-containing protein [Haploplasma axanthum]VEU81149.1 Fibronectin-binding protein A N-terminus (FbpA) [Haploplasma axanthum]